MGTISVRVSDDMEKDLQGFLEDEKLEQTSEAARKVLALGLESWHQEKALMLLQQGKVSLPKAAAIAKMNIWDFVGLVTEKKIVWIQDKVITEDLAKASS